MATHVEGDKMAACLPPTLFSIPELVHSILLHLPVRDLLRVQRVCRLWKETTDHSLALQRKLFFVPVSNADQEPECNPLLREVFPPWFPNHYHDSSDIPFSDDFSPGDLCKTLKWYADEYRRMRVLSPEASWRRMFPVQPPPARIEEIYTEGGCSCFYRIAKGVIREHFQHLQEPSVTMGFLWDVGIHVLEEKWEPKTLGLHWHMFPFIPTEEALKDVHFSRWIEELGPVRNVITMDVRWSNDCYPSGARPSGLSVGYFDPDIIKWDFDDEGNPGV